VSDDAQHDPLEPAGSTPEAPAAPDVSTGSTSAPEVSTGSPASPGVWEELLAAPDIARFCTAWLEIQAAWIGGVDHAVLAWQRLGDPQPIELSRLPGPRSAGLEELLARSLAEGRGLALADETHADRVALSHVIELARGTRVAVAVEVGGRAESAWPVVLRHLQWGMAWLPERLESELRHGVESLPPASAADVLDLVAVAVEARDFEEAAHAVATQLAASLRCDRVSLGFDERGHMRVKALSHSADFGKQMNLMVAIAAAMDEARDQGVSVAYPPRDAPGARIHHEHERLSREHGAKAVLTVPLLSERWASGAITLETTSEEGFGQETVRFVEAAAAALAPLLALRQRDDRALPVKAALAAREQAVRLLGAGYLGRKVVALGALVAALFFAFAEGEYRISADGVLEGSRRRVIVAPFDGYVAMSDLRAGDMVVAGDVLAQLDDRDLRLEQLKWRSRDAQYQRQYDEARAAGERAQTRILAAQIEEADAELARIDERIERTRVTAPFDALVVAGDLTQSLGAAVARGDVLFELAPLDRYRVLLEVDEQQIGDVHVGQTGSVLLAAIPNEPLAFEVTKLTPLARAEEGANTFRVEGVLGEVSGRLRPGMEGVGKIDVGPRNLFWIWTRGLQSWLRLRLWTWWP
jgi:multidrug efflux pump subunit AcrA (membrane-fusion protein)